MVRWLLVIVGVVLLILCVLSPYSLETFTTVDLDTAKAQRQMLQFEGEGRYNHFARIQSTKTTIPADQVEAALQQEVPVPGGGASLMTLLGYVGLGAAAPPGGGTGVEQTGAVQQKINFCESQVAVNCDLLDDPRFAECGFCHRDGVDSNGKAHRGGMYISSDDQIRANAVSNANGAPAIYNPTVGTCKPQNFSLMKENCQVRELQMQCQGAGGATSTNSCGQCFGGSPAGTTGLLYVGPKPRTYTAVLWVSHPGSHSAGGAGLSVKYPNGAVVTLPYSTQPVLDPKQLTLEIAEGDNLVITVSGVPPVWCGWLSSPDGNRTVGLDIGEQSISPAAGFTIAGDKRSVIVNKLLASSPVWASWQTQVPNTVMWYQRRNEVVPGAIVSAWYGNTVQGSSNAQGLDVTDYVKMGATTGQDLPITNQYFQNDPAPGIPKHIWINQDTGNSIIVPEGGTVTAASVNNYLTMNFTVPATLVDPIFAEDKAACPSGPIIFTEVGAGLMGAHSCFAADGSFNPSMFCIQELWTAAGGTTQGTLYPRTDAAAAALAFNDPATGKPSLDATVQALNRTANIAMYGVDMNGAPQDFATVKAAALQMLGVTMNNPCDGPTAQTGPHSPECLDYLWRTGQDAPNVDPTTLPYAYCSAQGQAAPLNADGTVNQANVAAANATGAIPNVRAYFQGIFNRSQDNSDFDAQAAAMRACFNVNIQPPPETPSDCPLPNPDEWQCFGPTKLALPEVFQIGGYTNTQAAAESVCETYGARVATSAELATAQQQGADWCSAGWVSDSNTPMYPITTSTGPGCGNGGAGVMSYAPPNGLAGVNCFGKKPAQGASGILPFNGSAWLNPNSLPGGATVIRAKEVANSIYCNSADGANCKFYPDEATCQTTAPEGSAAGLGGPMASAIDQYLRARV